MNTRQRLERLEEAAPDHGAREASKLDYSKLADDELSRLREILSRATAATRGHDPRAPLDLSMLTDEELEDMKRICGKAAPEPGAGDGLADTAAQGARASGPGR